MAFITRINLFQFVTFRPLHYTSFESVEMSLRVNRASVSCICWYRPPPSKTNKMLNSTFLREFPELLSSHADCRRDVSFLGDLNFHFEDCSDPQANRLKLCKTISDCSSLSAYSLTVVASFSTGSWFAARRALCPWKGYRTMPAFRTTTSSSAVWLSPSLHLPHGSWRLGTSELCGHLASGLM